MISIIVPWRSEEPQRVRTWEYVKRAWQRHERPGELELVWAHDGRSSGPFGRAEALNRAFAWAQGDVVVTQGANILPNFDAVMRAVPLAYRYGWSPVCDQAQCYSLEDTEQILAGRSLQDFPENAHAYSCPNMHAVHRDAWIALGGYDEDFGTGYGYEDSAMLYLLRHHFGEPKGAGGVMGILDHGGPSDGEARIAPENETLFVERYVPLKPGSPTPDWRELLDTKEPHEHVGQAQDVGSVEGVAGS